MIHLGAHEEIIDLLIKTERLPEAALFARSYCPEQISDIVKLWKGDLAKNNKKKVSESLADPAQYPNLFPELTKEKGEESGKKES